MRKIIYEYKDIIIFKEINYNRFCRSESESKDDRLRKLYLRKDRDIVD